MQESRWKIIGRLKPESLDDLLRGYYLEKKVAEYEKYGHLSNGNPSKMR